MTQPIMSKHWRK